MGASRVQSRYSTNLPAVARIAIDISPLKKSADFRNLWAAGLITYLGSMITYVVVPFQIKEMTNSYVAAALPRLVESSSQLFRFQWVMPSMFLHL